MPLTVSITVQQNNGTPSNFTLVDTSTGSDPSITIRRVYLTKPDGTFLVPEGTTTDYIEWPIAESSITLDVLDRDRSLEILVEWLAGAVVTYEYENSYVFTAYTNTFLYNLSVDQSSNPSIINATDFFANKTRMYSYVKEAENAIAIGEDTVKAQLALDRAYQFIINEDKYF